MKVCKFEKIKDEDDIKQVINCIRQEHPYVAVLPVLTQLQEWMQAISASWFHEEDEASHTTVNAIEEYCYSLTNHLITEPQLNQDMKIRIRECIKKIHALVEDKADLLIDKTIKESIFINTLLLGNLSFIVLLSANRIIGIDSKFNIAIVPSLNNMLSSIK